VRSTVDDSRRRDPFGRPAWPPLPIAPIVKQSANAAAAMVMPGTISCIDVQRSPSTVSMTRLKSRSCSPAELDRSRDR
jgi:hypothetical protein